MCCGGRLGSPRLFSYPGVFQTFKWSWKNAVGSQVVFLSRPQLGAVGGRRLQRSTHISPPGAHKGTYCAELALPLPDGFTICSAPSSLESAAGSGLPLTRQAGLGPSGLDPPFLALWICLSTVLPSGFSFTAVLWSLRPLVKCGEGYSQSETLPGTWLSPSPSG